MAEIVDVRPDRLLREMRETGNVFEACKRAGMTPDELNAECQKNPKFDMAVNECHLEYIEETLIKTCEAEIEKLWRNKNLKMARLRAQALADFHARHPELETANG